MQILLANVSYMVNKKVTRSVENVYKSPTYELQNILGTILIVVQALWLTLGVYFLNTLLSEQKSYVERNKTTNVFRK